MNGESGEPVPERIFMFLNRGAVGARRIHHTSRCKILPEEPDSQALLFATDVLCKSQGGARNTSCIGGSIKTRQKAARRRSQNGSLVVPGRVDDGL